MNDEIRNPNDENAPSVACACFGIRISDFVIALLVVCLAIASPARAADADLSDPDTAVEAGRSALQSQSWTTWYDRQADTYKPLRLRPPRKPSNWNMNWLSGLFSGMSSLGDVLVFLMWLLVAALVVGIVVALLRAWQQAERNAVDATAETTADHDQISRVEALPVTIDKPMTNLLGEARRLAALGDYAAAIVYLFSHQLVEADRAGAVRLRKGKTNRQYLRELRRNRRTQVELPPLLEATILGFERSFFGRHALTAAGFEACLAGAEQFDELLKAETQEEAA